uniref:Uncharacterized protein n=1 Tax=Rhizophora mucronata TaxID=61149 RepID=A0A2P2PJ29_RHIMU
MLSTYNNSLLFPTVPRVEFMSFRNDCSMQMKISRIKNFPNDYGIHVVTWLPSAGVILTYDFLQVKLEWRHNSSLPTTHRSHMRHSN